MGTAMISNNNDGNNNDNNVNHENNGVNMLNVSNLLSDIETQPLRGSYLNPKENEQQQQNEQQYQQKAQYYGTTSSESSICTFQLNNRSSLHSHPNSTIRNSNKKHKTKSSHSTTSNYSSNPFYPRLIPRNLPFQQSKNTVNIQNVETYHTPLVPSTIQYILTHNWVHVLLNWPTFASLSFLVLLWLLFVLCFGWVYYKIDWNYSQYDVNNYYQNCRLNDNSSDSDSISLRGAFAFSLETCTTVGYGLPNSSNNLFEPECQSVLIAITIQMVSSMLFNAFITAFVWVRIARCEKRGTQVVFSNKAIINYDSKNKKWFFNVRTYDLNSQKPVVEAHVRFLCLSWMDYENQSVQNEQSQITQTMRLIHPNDDLGGMLFLSVPTTITHHIDAYSPLTPNNIKEENKDKYFQGNGLMIREADQFCGSNSKTFCPICGETYETFEQLKVHIQYNKIIEDQTSPKLPIEGTHRDTSILTPQKTKKMEIRKEDIMENLRGKEILVLVEGIEPIVSGTFQALHSYKIEDIVFDCCFAPCMSQINGKAVVDLDRFHEVIPTLPLPVQNHSNSKANTSTSASTSVSNSSHYHESVVTSSLSSDTGSDCCTLTGSKIRRTVFSHGASTCK